VSRNESGPTDKNKITSSHNNGGATIDAKYRIEDRERKVSGNRLSNSRQTHSYYFSFNDRFNGIMNENGQSHRSVCRFKHDRRIPHRPSFRANVCPVLHRPGKFLQRYRRNLGCRRVGLDVECEVETDSLIFMAETE